MKIIDTHTHLGVSKLSGLTITEDDLLNAMNIHGVEVALVMPHAVTNDYIAAHQAVEGLCNRYPGRFRGIVNLSPLLNESEYHQKASHYVRDLRFVALKLNPQQHLASPLMKNSEKVFNTADELGVPVIVHTGLGAPWALPSLCIPQAKRHPNIAIILAHAGHAIYTAEAYVAAIECANIYLEPSWCTIYDLNWLISEVGADRILFGSDLPENLPIELAKYRNAKMKEEELALCLGGTAARVFRLN